MKRKLFCSIIVSALLLGGCAESVDTQQSKGGSQTVNPDSIPVGFDAYQNRTVSRSGWAGVLDNAQLAETKANGGGFGVFAYYTDLKNYDQSYVPNFMYNRGVFYNGEDGTSGSNRWEYKPIVYWPNEYGFDAASDDEDHLSFFAYAPYTPMCRRQRVAWPMPPMALWASRATRPLATRWCATWLRSSRTSRWISAGVSCRQTRLPGRRFRAAAPRHWRQASPI